MKTKLSILKKLDFTCASHIEVGLDYDLKIIQIGTTKLSRDFVWHYTVLPKSLLLALKSLNICDVEITIEQIYNNQYVILLKIPKQLSLEKFRNILSYLKENKQFEYVTFNSRNKSFHLCFNA